MNLQKKKVTYWSPHINKVATVQAVYNSVKSLKNFSQEKFEPEIIDAFGEWEEFHNNDLNINFYKLYKFKFLNRISSDGFIFSRIKYTLIFLLSSLPLTMYLLRKKPDYFIIHLITSLPLFLNYFFDFKTKIVLRISGKPQLNFFRYFFWKITLRKIYKITFPTEETYQYFKKLNIVENDKLAILSDPIIDSKKIIDKIKEKDEKDKNIENYYLSIGRLTKQKNFSFLIDCFKNLNLSGNNSKLVIIGEGEEYKKLTQLINSLNLQNNIFLVGYKKNVFTYLKKAKGFILSSLWEDPGFVLIEAIYSNTIVISSDCPSGPKELIGDRKGVLFKSNSHDDFIKKFNYLDNLSQIEIDKLRINAKKNIKKFTIFNHYKVLTTSILN